MGEGSWNGWSIVFTALLAAVIERCLPVERESEIESKHAWGAINQATKVIELWSSRRERELGTGSAEGRLALPLLRDESTLPAACLNF